MPDRITKKTHLIQFIENIILLVFLISISFISIKKYQNNIVPLAIFIFMISIYGNLFSNPGTAIRWKYGLIFMYLFYIQLNYFLNEKKKTKKIALITGVTGQDGSLLADFLKKNYKVIGIKRRSSTFNSQRIDHLYTDIQKPNNFKPYYGDLTDSSNLIRVIQSTKPDEIYNLGAQSHVHTSFETPEYTANADALGTLRILEAIRILGLQKKTKFYQASTSEIFGNSKPPQNENTPFQPESPYGTAKLYAYWITKNYRKAYSIFACNGILFNHEGPKRGETFVTRKLQEQLLRFILTKEKLFF